MDLFIKPSSQNQDAALYGDVTCGVFAQVPDMVAGDVVPVNVYLVDGVGGYDPSSGSSELSVRIAISDPSEAFTRGTFTLTNGTETTAPISFDATALDIQAALNALPSIATYGGVTVSGSGGVFEITGNTGGDFFDLIGNATNLSPIGSIETITP